MEGVGKELEVPKWTWTFGEKLTVGKDFNSDRLCFLMVEDHWME